MVPIFDNILYLFKNLAKEILKESNMDFFIRHI
jgi:hypothetical protein